jgi:hypothetical protein
MSSAERSLRLTLGAGLAVIAASFVVVRGPAGPAEGLGASLLAAAVLATPYVSAWAAGRADARGAPAVVVGLLQVVCHAAPLAILGALGADALLLGALLSFATHLFRLRGGDAAAAGAIVAAPIVVTAGFAVAPGIAWLALYPAALATAAAGAVALQARRSARARPEDEAPRGPWLYAVPLTLLWIVASLAVHLGVHVAPAPLFHLTDTGLRVERIPTDADGEQRERARDAQETFQQIFPGGLDHGRGVTQLQQETVMTVRPSDGRDHGQLYLRGMVLDVLTARGATYRGGARERLRAGSDGWIALAERSEAASTFDIEQQPIRIRNGDLGILFAPQRPLALRLDADRDGAIEYDPDGLLVAQASEADWLRFRVVCAERRGGHVELGTERARHPDPLYVARPSGPAGNSGSVLAALDREAARATAGARTDAERVIRLVRWFQTEFTYDLQASEFPGLDGVADFVRAKRGPCTWFASAATLMLRGMDVPTRIATGFVAKERDPGTGAYAVTSREGHAWIEVFFEGPGWVSFDPTPGRQRADALAAAFDAYAEPGLAGWARNLASRLREWATSGGEAERMRDVMAALARGPRAAWDSLRARVGAWGAGALVAAAVLAALVKIARFLRRGRAPSAAALARAEPAVDRRVASLRARLIAALAELGFPRRPPQTLPELARRAALALGELVQLPGLDEIVALLDRARFGGKPLSPEEESSVEAVLEELARRAAPAG